MLLMRRREKTFWACILDAERILSMQRNIAGLHGTRFGLVFMEARLRIGQSSDATAS
jgi:hypothetical protein